MTYEMDIAGLKRELPLCKLNDELCIGAFVMFGDVELEGASQARAGIRLHHRPRGQGHPPGL